MSWMIWIGLATLAAWIGAGVLVLRLGARPVASSGLVRTLSKPVVTVGEEAEVVVALRPPVDLGEIAPRDLVLVLDRSGSMGSGPASRLGAALRAAGLFLAACPPQLRVGLVTFHHEAERTCALGEASRVQKVLRGVEGDGGTAIHLAVEAARDELLDNGRAGVAKTLFLLSDGGSDAAAARNAAASLRQAIPEAEILAAALGSDVHRALLAELAGGDENLFTVSSESELDRLFSSLARRLGGAAALSVLGDEGANVPRPLRLSGVDPVTSAVSRPSEGGPTRLRWALPALDPRPIRLAYRLQAVCPGWHRVAADLQVSWLMPDGSERSCSLGGGPRLLVLPPLLGWAWPLLNPLLFLLAGKGFCPPEEAVVEEKGEAEPLPEPSLPAPPPTLEAAPFRPAVEAALIVALGALGEEVLCRLRHRLEDRGVPRDRIDMRLVDLDHGVWEPQSHGAARVRPDERLGLFADFYPYLDALRRDGVPETRGWVPWQEWLASCRPTTSAGEVERRRARLAVVQTAGALDAALAPRVDAAVAAEARVVVVASVDDPVASGLAGEVLHLAAGRGARTLLLLATERVARPRERAALERELTRWVVLRGDAVSSDRCEPPCVARRLVDRVAVTTEPEQGEEPAEAAFEALYAALTVDRVAAAIPAVDVVGERPEVCRIRLQARVWPEEHLWCWLRDRTLVREVVRGMLGWSPGQEDPEAHGLAAQDEAAISRWAAAFWSGEAARRRANLLVREGPTLLSGTPAHVVFLGQVPHDAPVHEQVVFHRAQRRRFYAYLDDWCRRLADEERRQGGWGLDLLEAALRRLADDHGRLEESAANLGARSALAPLGRLVADLYRDQRQTLLALLRQVRKERDRWVRGAGSVAGRLVAGRLRAERSLAAMVDVSSLTGRAESWADEHGPDLCARLAFEPRIDVTTGSGRVVVWLGDQPLAEDDDGAEALRRELGRVRGSVGDDWQGPAERRGWNGPRPAFRLGGRSAAMFPDVVEPLDESDPWYGGVVSFQRLPLDEALNVVGHRPDGLPFVWPEEANAQRLASWLRQPPVQREPLAWPPRVVQLLRDPAPVLALLAELALGRVELRGERWGLCRSAGWQAVADAIADLPASQALSHFETAVRQVVLQGVSLDGEPLPGADDLSWRPEPEAAVAAVAAHPLVQPATASSGWAIWVDVIQALVVESR